MRIAARNATAVVCLVVTVIGFGAAGISNRRLVAMRDRHGIDSGTALENAPPLMVFTTVVLGGFRGVIADVLWLRVSYLQDQGQYVELVQLTDWITKLEPRCGEIWGFHAWNLAYNISVMFGTSEDRWRWVEHGIRLLRDQGLHYNPGDASLCRELGWLYQHKIGTPLDSAHLHYRHRLAEAVSAVLPDGRLPHTPPADVVRRLDNTLRLDATLMREVDTRHGPLDWRLPQSHAVYWAEKGRLTAQGHSLASCDRMVFQSLATLFSQGKLEYCREAKTYVTRPDVALLPKVINAYERAIEEHGQESMRTGYANFLRRAVLLLGQLDCSQEARTLSDRLRRLLPSDDTDEGYDAYMSRHSEVD
jgi:hypothetical protein